MKTILATTYAVNPNKGSEDGMGWNFVLQIARHHKVIAVTRENNKKAIDQFMAENPDEVYQNVSFLYFDLPYWMRFWKKGSRGAMLYYILWQYFVVYFVKKQHLDFDIVHNLNFHNDWTPSFLWKLGKPFVWGPVGHHPMIPSQYLKVYPKKYWIKDRLTWLVKKYFWAFSYSLSKTKRMASHIMCMNSSVPDVLDLNRAFSITPSVATKDFGWEEENKSEMFTVISAGRFVPLKGFDLTINAFADMVRRLPAEQKNKTKLILAGSGPEENLLKNLCRELGISHQVQFIAWMERDQLMQKMKEASLFLFPSHEGAGMVVAEALSFGLPVICLANEGPGQFIDDTFGFTIPHGNYDSTVVGLSEALQRLFYRRDDRMAMRKAARQRFETLFHWDRRGEQLQKIYAVL